MQEIKRRVLSKIEVNPTLSIDYLAHRFGVCTHTVSKWFNEAGLKRWSC